MSGLYNERKVYSATPRHAPDGRFDDNFSLLLVPKVVDPDRTLGSQLIFERFTPTSKPRPDGYQGEVYDGWVGDPGARQEAMLTIDTLAQARNRRRRSNGAAVVRGVQHDPEGSLIVITAGDS